RFGRGGGGSELLGNPLHHLRFSHRALLRVLGGWATRVAPAVDPVDVAGVLRAWQARYPHGTPAGGKLTIGEVAVSRGVHAVSGVSWKTPHAYLSRLISRGLYLLYASLLTPVASRNLLAYQSLPASTPYRHANVRRQKDDPGV